MCDNIVALGKATADGSVIFGKNSDRDPNEAQPLSWVPAQDHAPGSELRCTWRSIPQVDHTHAVLLSRPPERARNSTAAPAGRSSLIRTRNTSVPL